MQNCTNSPEDQAASVCPPPPQFPGDDTRPTSKKELAGWYSYGWAAEVFTVCAMGSFLPITLEQMARERGVLLSDKKTPCSATWSSLESTSPSGTWNTIFDATAFTKPGSPRTSQCIIYILGVEINTASFAMYTFSLSVFIQAILIISMSGAADHGSYRKMLLVIFALIGSVSTMLFLAVVPRLYLLVACIILFELVPLYGLLGFIPAIKSLGYLGLQQPWEMYPLGVIYGLVMGGLSSYCRSFFGELIPPGYEAAFYALYAITDKGSSVFGPAIVGIITDRYGEIRPAFVFLAVLILLPLPLMLLVDVERGKRDALSLSKELKGRPRQEVPVYGAVTHCPSHSENLAE
ncbi:hypothetical protein CBS63078_8096 [Aspergillus niger]|nr:hypothetical protein CBS133816_10831 [Aspergillus niger]KAI2815797.1 hypothetical protein CBS115989_7360 [Aspergillus niger]KAI2848187.1 hypothetical protein CBS11232_6904 [Aspergillus niger]KAI2863462.1 hypothetical protein CBS12448_3760 [Aspergillus niger]KAI2896950.1 hypothetical protein CBS63078_8096 [Aspergillus niger]